MNSFLKSLTVFLFFLILADFTFAQAPFIIKLNQEEKITGSKHFYVTDVLEGRKDSLNNGFTLINKKKTKVEIFGGAAFQLGQYLITKVLPDDSLKIPVTVKISKLMLTERTTLKGNIVKAELSVQFLRKDGDELVQLNELGSWMEQSATADAVKLQEKSIREILNRMLIQFDKLVEEQSENPLFAPIIVFKVIHTLDDNVNDDTIYWTSNLKLKWADFKGKPGNGDFAAQSNCAFAQSIIPIVENDSGIFYINVRAAFFKKESWVKKDQDNDEILAHEQLHFDIAEWQIRLLRKQIMEQSLSINNYTELINSLYNEVWTKYNSLQDAYDRETAHGTIKDEQDRWINKVANELDGLKDYE